MFDLVPRLVFFALVAIAPRWRSLAWRAGIGMALLAAAFGWATDWRFGLAVPAGDANIGAGIVLYLGLIALAPAVASRALSLWADRLGHRRPWSLWIEGVAFFGAPVALNRLVLGI